MSTSGSSYVGGDFEYDVFLSYAWANNDPKGVGGEWVTEFHNRLLKVVSTELGRDSETKFFFDIETLGRNVEFGDQIEDALRKSATVVAVISKSYVESPNCRKELEFFNEVVGGAISKSGRLFIVWYDDRDSKGDWSDDQFDKLIPKLIGYDFYESMKSVPRGRPLKPEETPYQTALIRLRQALTERMRHQKQAIAENKDSGSEPSSTSQQDTNSGGHKKGGPTILIAQTTNDKATRDRRRELASWCRDAECQVLGENGYPLDPQEFKTAFVSDLKKSNLVVQLFSDGWVPVDAKHFPNGIEQWQQEQIRFAGVDLIQWRDRSFPKPTDEEQSGLPEDELRHLDLVFGDNVITVEPAELHRVAFEYASTAYDLGKRTVATTDEQMVLVKVTKGDLKVHEPVLHDLERQAICKFVHNGQSVVERCRRRKYDFVMVVLGKECTEEWFEDREDELIEARATFKDEAPVQVWFDTGTYKGERPITGPGILMINDISELLRLNDGDDTNDQGGAP